jgi:hypothetical protein
VTPKQSRSLARYISDIAREYGLSGWTIVGHEGTDSEDHAAEVTCLFGRKVAHLNLSADFASFTPEEQRQTVLHELTHIHLDQMNSLMHSVLPEVMGLPAYSAFFAGYNQAMEHATDAIAVAIADKFPLWEG